MSFPAKKYRFRGLDIFPAWRNEPKIYIYIKGNDFTRKLNRDEFHAFGA